ncbi:hypothetical protein LPJ61_005399, partial [Coemansia biformis]
MSPTSVVQQAFWDRIPNATSKIALLGRAGCPADHPRPAAEPEPPQSPARVSKRKQSHPARSPLAGPPANDTRARGTGSGEPHSQGVLRLGSKARRLSLDRHLSAPRPLRADVQSRAFRLSFSDEYLRNPHQYVQALITSEGQQLLSPAQRPSPGGSSRSRRSQCTRPRVHASGSSRRSRSGRFHNLQLEQPVAMEVLSENDDSNSVTTAASDLNDLMDTDEQPPATPTRAKSHLRLETPVDTTPHANSP